MSRAACCVFHKPRAFGESDSEESDSDWEGFDEPDGSAKMPPVTRKAQPKVPPVT